MTLQVLAVVQDQFHSEGWAIVDRVIDDDQRVKTVARLEQLDIEAVGARNLLDLDWCGELARTLLSSPAIAPILTDRGKPMVAVQCTFFEKSSEKNWLVGMHQDLSIPVADKVEDANLRGWSRKDGMWFVQPTIEVLERMIAIRLHLDTCRREDGPLKIVPHSHTRGWLDDDEISTVRETNGEVICCVEAGSVQIMHPLLLHASSKASGVSRRRVLHFLFGPDALPCNLQWHKAVAQVGIRTMCDR